ncbi:hypothetical protein Pint_18307 [Pistacia integerrima]|uniref:Uncharacterized protein n=1 Tax=Pistacia integerrima TaxID=434235 RepID=A0ACC0YY70_9ROSI|nr:hypothetical protein Pint_18307 [Pistacia integerrima]
MANNLWYSKCQYIQNCNIDEAVFYSALALVLCHGYYLKTHFSTQSAVKPYTRNMEEHTNLENDSRYLQLSDVRIPLTFVSFPPFLSSLFFYFITYHE